MERRKKHLQCLVYFAMADNNFAAEEKDFIRQVGKRLRLNDEEINIILDTKFVGEPQIPETEVERYILFDDIFNLIAVDKKITEEERTETRKIAQRLGFTIEIADNIIGKLNRHIELGFDNNQISHSVKNSVFSLTNNINSHGKYSL